MKTILLRPSDPIPENPYLALSVLDLPLLRRNGACPGRLATGTPGTPDFEPSLDEGILLGTANSALGEAWRHSAERHYAADPLIVEIDTTQLDPARWGKIVWEGRDLLEHERALAGELTHEEAILERRTRAMRERSAEERAANLETGLFVYFGIIEPEALSARVIPRGLIYDSVLADFPDIVEGVSARLCSDPVLQKSIVEMAFAQNEQDVMVATPTAESAAPTFVMPATPFVPAAKA